MPSGTSVPLAGFQSLRTGTQTQELAQWQTKKKKWCRYSKKSVTFQDRTGSEGLMWKEGWGLSEEQKRRSSPAPVIGLPRLSFLRDQSHRSCLQPNCWTNQLSYRPLISRLCLSASKTICTETPVVVAEQRVWHVCVWGGGYYSIQKFPITPS